MQDWNQESANSLISKCGFLLLTEVPQGIEFGIDYNPCYTTGPLFKGFKLVPPGVHFIYYQVPNKEGGSGGPRKSLFLFVDAQQVVVKHWDPRQEELVDMEDKDQEERLVGSDFLPLLFHQILATKSFQFDQNLAPYALEQYSHWNSLTAHISSDTISRIQQTSVLSKVKETSLEYMAVEPTTEGNVPIQEAKESIEKKPELEFLEKFKAGIPIYDDGEDDYAGETWNIPDKPTRSVPSKTEDTKNIPRLDDPTSSVPFLSIPKYSKIRNAVPEKVTQMNFDKTFQLVKLIRKFAQRSDGKDKESTTGRNTGLSEVVSEFESSFAMFVLGQSFEGFEQWKKFVELFSRCESGMTYFPNRSAEAIQGLSPEESNEVSIFLLETYPKILFHQISEVPEDYFEDIVEGNNFLVTSLKEYFELVEDHITPRTESTLKNLKNLARKRFNIQPEIQNLDEDDDENMPVMVSREELLKLNISEEELERILNS